MRKNQENSAPRSICVIVGGAGLLGSAFARTIAATGAHVIIADLDTKKGTALIKEIGGSFEKMDSTSPLSIRDAARKIAKNYGRIDALVVSSYPRHARYGAHASEVRFEDFSAFLSAHVVGYFECARTFSSLMNKGGSIIFLGSIYGIVAPRFDIYKGTTMTTPIEYAAAKGAIIQMTSYLAALYGMKGIRVNAVSPGGIFANQPRSFVKAYAKHVRLGKGMLATEDVCGSVMFLLSPASKHVTGQNIVVDGGWTL